MNLSSSKIGTTDKSRNHSSNSRSLATDRNIANAKLSASTFVVDHQEKPLISLRIKLSSD